MENKVLEESKKGEFGELKAVVDAFEAYVYMFDNHELWVWHEGILSDTVCLTIQDYYEGDGWVDCLSEWNNNESINVIYVNDLEFVTNAI